MRTHDFLITLVTQDGYFLPIRPIPVFQFLTKVLLVLSDGLLFRAFAFKVHVAQVTREQLSLFHKLTGKILFVARITAVTSRSSSVCLKTTFLSILMTGFFT